MFGEGYRLGMFNSVFVLKIFMIGIDWSCKKPFISLNGVNFSVFVRKILIKQIISIKFIELYYIRIMYFVIVSKIEKNGKKLFIFF